MIHRRCENCGCRVLGKARFCKQCGHELGVATHETQTPPTPRCPECGQFVTEDAERCQGCRAILPWNDPLQRALLGGVTARQLILGTLAVAFGLVVVTDFPPYALGLVAATSLFVGYDQWRRRGTHLSRRVLGVAGVVFLLSAVAAIAGIGELPPDRISNVTPATQVSIAAPGTTSTSDVATTVRPSSTTTVPTTEPPSTTTTIKGMVVTLLRVTDGDTIVVRMPDGTEERVRYIGVDSPEPGDAADMGTKATANNTYLLGEGPLRLELDAEERDQYGRLLAYVWAGDIFVNRRMVLDGYAQVATFPPNVVYEADFLDAQQKAEDAQAGFWAPTTTRTVAAEEPPNSGSDIIVHVTKTGAKYHRAGCQYLSRSDIPVTLAKAKADGYDP